MWCPDCKQTREQLKEKRRFSRRVLATCIIVVFVWVASIGLSCLAGKGGAALGIGIGLLGAILLFVCFLTAGGLHNGGQTDVFSEYRCPECDSRMSYGRPKEDQTAGNNAKTHHVELKRAEKTLQEPKQEAAILRVELAKSIAESDTSINGVRRCPGCKRPVDQAASFCGQCGQRLKKPVEQA